MAQADFLKHLKDSHSEEQIQDRLSDRDRQLATKEAEISNYNQSQYLLGQMGKWVANAAAAAGA